MADVSSSRVFVFSFSRVLTSLNLEFSGGGGGGYSDRGGGGGGYSDRGGGGTSHAATSGNNEIYRSCPI